MMYPAIEIIKSFHQKSVDYERVARVQLEIGQRLFERLDLLKMYPRTILDLGCGTGFLTMQLKKKYPKACIIGLDMAKGMLMQSKKKHRLWRQWSLVCANIHALPFADGAIDLIISNQVIHWSNTLPLVFKELSRILAPQGCLMFSTLGPDTFQELRKAWATVDAHAHTNHFQDMHDIGDLLLQTQFADPVVDMEMLRMDYASVMTLIQRLKTQGVRNVHPNRRPGLTTKKVWDKFVEAYPQTPSGHYPLTYEVIYGHAWKGSVKKPIIETESRIAVSSVILK